MMMMMMMMMMIMILALFVKSTGISATYHHHVADLLSRSLKYHCVLYMVPCGSYWLRQCHLSLCFSSSSSSNSRSIRLSVVMSTYDVIAPCVAKGNMTPAAVTSLHVARHWISIRSATGKVSCAAGHRVNPRRRDQRPLLPQSVIYGIGISTVVTR